MRVDEMNQEIAMAMVLNEDFEYDADERVDEAEYLPSYMRRPYSHGRTPVHYWLASLALSVVVWWAIVSPLTNLL
jgi:hypothetical protein